MTYVVSILLVKCFAIDILGARLIVWHMPFFFSGYWAARGKEKIIPYKHAMIQASLVAFPVMLAFYRWNGSDTFILMDRFGGPLAEYINLAYRYAIAFCGISLSFYMIKRGNNQKIQAFFAWLGARTLEIYILHYFFIHVKGSNLVDQNNVLEFVVTILFASVFSVSLAILISSFLKKSRVLGVVLFGA